MNILLVVHQFLPHYTGGTEVYVGSLAQALRAMGHKVVIFAGAESFGLEDWDGVPVITVPGGVRGPRGVVGNFLTAFANPKVEEVFRRLCLEEKPDVVHFHHLLGLSPELISITKRLGIPAVFTLHDYWFLCPNAQLMTRDGGLCQGPKWGVNCTSCAAGRLGIPKPLEGMAIAAAPLFAYRQHRLRRAFEGVDMVIAPSRFMRDMAIKGGVPREKVLELALGIDSEALLSQRDGRVFPETKGKAFVYIGSLAPQKGVHVLVEAFKLWKSNGFREERDGAELRIYGDTGTYPHYCQSLLAEAAGFPIRFMGPLARENLGEALAEAYALVVPSLWYENSPLVIEEASAILVPVIASRIGALAEKVEDGVNGLLFRPGDPRDLAQAMGDLAGDPALHKKLKQNIKQVKSIQENASEMESIYQKLAGQRADG